MTLEARFRFDFRSRRPVTMSAGSLALLLFQLEGQPARRGATFCSLSRSLPKANRTELELTVAKPLATSVLPQWSVTCGSGFAHCSDEHCLDTTAPPSFMAAGFEPRLRQRRVWCLALCRRVESRRVD